MSGVRPAVGQKSPQLIRRIICFGDFRRFGGTPCFIKTRTTSIIRFVVRRCESRFFESGPRHRRDDEDTFQKQRSCFWKDELFRWPRRRPIYLLRHIGEAMATNYIRRHSVRRCGAQLPGRQRGRGPAAGTRAIIYKYKFDPGANGWAPNLPPLPMRWAKYKLTSSIHISTFHSTFINVGVRRWTPSIGDGDVYKS